jgi:hypothetical protein
MDVNENIYRKRFGRELTDAEGLDMIETVGNFTSQ